MSRKSSASPTMRAMLVGAALTGLIAGTTTSAQAAAAGSSGVSTHVSAKLAGDVATTTGAKSIWGHCRRYCYRGCYRSRRRTCRVMAV